MQHLLKCFYQLWTAYVVRLGKVPDKELIEDEIELPDRAIRLFRRFPVDELRSATRDFSDALVIGKGGFGKVYKGLINNAQQIVAIKRLKACSRQGRREFLTEIKILSEVRHINLVSLIGFCNEHKEMILVYQYMSGGTLHDHLHKLAMNNDSDSFLTWKQRLNICIGAARGLEYLHTGHRIIHHDVKTSNILLDASLTPKVADFGLAKPEDRSELQSEHLTGTFGYMDPHYISTRILTIKGDIYAFGVVLLEVLCERPALDRMAEGEERHLASWAESRINNKGNISEIVASSLKGQVPQYSLETFVDIAQSCLHKEPKKRPTMAQVVAKLEVALEQHEKRNVPMCNQDIRIVDEINPCNGETKLLVGTDQVTVVNTGVDAVTPPKQHTNSKPVKDKHGAGYKHELKLKYACDALWNRENTSKNFTGWMLSVLRKQKMDHLNSGTSSPGPYMGCHIPLKVVQEATNTFDKSRVIGSGGLGKFYRGFLNDGLGDRDLTSREGQLQFRTEIEIRTQFLLR